MNKKNPATSEVFFQVSLVCFFKFKVENFIQKLKLMKLKKYSGKIR